MLFLSESGCKGRAFFDTRKTFLPFFRDFFWNILQRIDFHIIKTNKFIKLSYTPINPSIPYYFIARVIEENLPTLHLFNPSPKASYDIERKEEKHRGISGKTCRRFLKTPRHFLKGDGLLKKAKAKNIEYIKWMLSRSFATLWMTKAFRWRGWRVKSLTFMGESDKTWYIDQTSLSLKSKTHLSWKSSLPSTRSREA